ncbi:hypothetical protein Leryth_013702 [Lithospermum erythrorhizon]|nr:hypothetical protein Leryth_013702 [Lithospermum erythrorhizon]
MRMSCNGCRVLRKGCSADCSIEPCLKWIKNPQSQASATLFLAKFYGRAGLLNLVNAAPPQSRTEIFRSLLYEACGRIINPVYGSVGLLWTGKWELCQKAVEAVLKGAPITQIASQVSDGNNSPPLKTYDIRHVNKEDKLSGSNDRYRVRNRCRFKKSGSKGKTTRVIKQSGRGATRDSSHESSSLSHQSESAQVMQRNDRGKPSVSLDSEETAQAEFVAGAELENATESRDYLS